MNRPQYNQSQLDSAVRHFQDEQFLRRDLLKIGGAGFLGLTLPQLLSASEPTKTSAKPPGRAKSVIFLFQFGGPSHVDMFDMKPDAPDGIRSKFAPIQTSVPGLVTCEHLPETAKVMDRVALVRSVHHKMKNHNSAGYHALTGVAPPLDDQRLRELPDLYPAYGSIVDQVAPASTELPTFVSYPYVIADGSTTPGQRASFLGKKFDPLLITEDPNDPHFKLPELSLPANLSQDRLSNRRHMQRLLNRQSQLWESSTQARGLDDYYEKVLTMLASSRVQQAFDLTQESEKVRNSYGRTTYGQGCLLSRRLVEAGVKFVNVYFSKGIGGQSTTSGGWDTHGFNNTRMYKILPEFHLPITEQTLPTLLLDLETRGLLDETLVVWMGEFGRSPRINKNISRDHWPFCYTVLMAGGGIRGGAIHGASDKQGAYPDRDPATLGDIAATMYALLGIDPETQIYDRLDRPLPIAQGKPIQSIMA
ncbi:DUF1501 domain-containing protein [Symmachiella dynata]|uniref:DUF1501 domain-containing protein n=1 Tax=Symmachiella dynata TaxID=2527995 RepID=UPI0030EF1F2D